MKIIHLKKHIEKDTGLEYLERQDAYEILNEYSKEEAMLMYFIGEMVDFLNYYSFNTPTAYGDPKYSRKEGWIRGYTMAKRWEIEEEKEVIKIKCGRKYLLTFERPKIIKFNED